MGSRRLAVLALAAGILFLTQNQGVEVFKLNLYAFRILELAGILRVILRRELSSVKLNRIDRMVILLYSFITVVSLLRYTDESSYQIAAAVDATLAYFIFRALILTIEDFKYVLNRYVLLLVPFFGAVLIERLTFQNPFALVGANLYIADFREGVPRCTGSFRHAILMGSFGAVFLPIYIGLALCEDRKFWPTVGCVICLGIVGLSNSGGPLSSVVIGIIGWSLWIFRRKMRTVRYFLALILFVLALLMKAPLWALPAKISDLTGGGGWHRYYLIEMAIKSLSDWWIAGMPIEQTKDWFPYIIHTGGADITNEFISLGLSAGILAIVIFVILLVKAFKLIGEVLEAIRNTKTDNSHEFLVWGVGVSLLVHISNWFGVSYFDQIKFVWHLHIAIVAMLAEAAELLKAPNHVLHSFEKSEA